MGGLWLLSATMSYLLRSFLAHLDADRGEVLIRPAGQPNKLQSSGLDGVVGIVVAVAGRCGAVRATFAALSVLFVAVVVFVTVVLIVFHTLRHHVRILRFKPV